ncbi:hypothetical protein T440DRAFT_472685 [Plenodomus tracheiphilus IPT5]|uniref:Aminoglycoside phosphotransferase domain-containing protein n=1 Tax=Plenodomus tracheiphilus IPT5 TaxID=1408161 RepID=A0A6A7ARL5_9PLEO|nr:hypothetical protein T440DRAFT_472685 [Plenodomus tracheiphilus IPT5]
MPARSTLDEVASSLLAEKGLRLQSSKRIQSLWAGYGEIVCIVAVPESPESSTSPDSRTFVLKLVTPPPTKADDEGHTRKILSYQVEQYFYSQLAPHMPASIPVAKCLASINEHHPDGTSITAMILSDLRQEYPVAGEKREALSSTQVTSALSWLSGFHGFWWSRVGHMERSLLILPPLEEVQHNGRDTIQKTVWLNGGYTYLATRRKEYGTLVNDQEDEWSQQLTQTVEGSNRSIAELVATFLAPLQAGRSVINEYETLIHGDVKSENLFTSMLGEQVAFYDFQYVGLGLGVCDLAKLFTCSVPLNMLVTNTSLAPELAMQYGEKSLLERYLSKLKEASGKEYDWAIFVRHWETALVDWLRFQASWGFWGNTEWLEARVRSILKDQEWRKFVMDGVAMVDRANSQ